MFNRLKWLSLPLLAIVLTLGAGCSKDKSETPTTGTDSTGTSGGTAEYALNSCNDVSIAGTYQIKKALGTDAQISLKLNVTKAGDWTITTSTVNGISFSGSGKFTETGAQVVTLQGKGTPTAEGKSDITYKIGSTSCSVAATISGEIPVITSEYYYTMSVDGKTVTQVVTEANGYIASSGSSSYGEDAVYGGGILWDGFGTKPTVTTEIGIDVGTLHNSYSASNATFKAFFAPGTRKYSKDAAEGVRVVWTDEKDVVWASDYGAADQTNSTFSIISVADVVSYNGTYYIKVKMQFKCKLYNENGDVKEVTNGEVVTNFGFM